MSTSPKNARSGRTKTLTQVRPIADDFDEVLRLIDEIRGRTFAAVKLELVSLYWRIGEYISRKLESAAWGRSGAEFFLRWSPVLYIPRSSRNSDAGSMPVTSR
jgi:hypothetical protein